MQWLARLAMILALVSVFEADGLAQAGGSVADGSRLAPESAFISPQKYTNAFFGFSLPLPQGILFRKYPLAAADPSHHFLFGVDAVLLRSLSFNPHPTLTILTIMAEDVGPDAAQEAQKFASTEKGLKVTPVVIAGKQFWESESEEKGSGGKMQSINFATPLDRYVLEFRIASFDSKLSGQLQQSIHSIAFFDPTKAEEMAGPESKPYIADRVRNLDPGKIAGGTYANGELGLSFQFPAGWAPSETASENFFDEERRTGHDEAEQCTRILLWASKHPDGGQANDTDPRVVVTATDPACLSDFHFPTSASDREGIKQAGLEIVASFAGAPFMGEGQRSFNFYVSGDHLIIQLWNNPDIPGRSRKSPAPVYTSLECTVVDDYLLMRTFESVDPIELDRLKRIPIVWAPSSTGSPAK